MAPCPRQSLPWLGLGCGVLVFVWRVPPAAQAWCVPAAGSFCGGQPPCSCVKPCLPEVRLGNGHRRRWFLSGWNGRKSGRQALLLMGAELVPGGRGCRREQPPCPQDADPETVAVLTLTFLWRKLVWGHPQPHSLL